MQISTCYFSATGTTKQIVSGFLNELIEIGGYSLKTEYDITLPYGRNKQIEFFIKELVLVALPVYAGRLPNILLKFLKTLKGNGALAIPIVVYGNRDYDDALFELKDLLETCDFQVVAAAAFIGEHAFSKVISSGRPDLKDYEIIREYAHEINNKLASDTRKYSIQIKGQYPYRPYYTVENEAGVLVDFRKIKPTTSEACIDCKICSYACPMGAIDFYDVSNIEGICIKCCACIKKCPVMAKYFGDRNFIKHKVELETSLKDRKEPELFI